MNIRQNKIKNINYTTIFSSPQNKLIIVGDGFKHNKPSLLSQFKKNIHNIKNYFINLKF